ncbi:MAG: phosphopantothenoylcysteine decarboxylase, partial [Flavobacteriaceae bacterium]|nr:phosphopantothenoylcysteine decarboxylase [Flavobacteriaceae bacterium]
AASLGAMVTLISGPSHESVQFESITLIKIISAKQMYDEVHKVFGTSDIAILSAAVADYRPKEVAKQKIKKKEEQFHLALEKTEDILASLGKIKKKQFLVGFALETENELENAKTKLLKKNLDLIVLNSLNDAGVAFGSSTNKVTLLSPNNKVVPFSVKEKEQVAKDILLYIIENIDA